MKNFSAKDFFTRILTLLLLDLLLFVVALIFGKTIVPLLNSLLPKSGQAVSNGVCIFYLVLYYAVYAFAVYKNPGARAYWLYRTTGKEYRFGKDLAEYAKEYLLDDVLSYVVLCLPVHLMLSAAPALMAFASLFFIGQSTIYAVLSCNVWVAYLLNLVLYSLVMLLLVPVCHYFWDKKRIREQ